MSAEQMEYYQLHKKWRRAEFLDVSYLRNQTSNAPGMREQERQDWSTFQMNNVDDSTLTTEEDVESEGLEYDSDGGDGDEVNNNSASMFNDLEEDELDPFWS